MVDQIKRKQSYAVSSREIYGSMSSNRNLNKKIYVEDKAQRRNNADEGIDSKQIRKMQR